MVGRYRRRPARSSLPRHRFRLDKAGRRGRPAGPHTVSRAGQQVPRLRPPPGSASQSPLPYHGQGEDGPDSGPRRAAPRRHDHRPDAQRIGAAGNTSASAERAPLADDEPRVVTARYPNHVWHVDLSAVPIVAGLALPWLPFALPQRWPFCWWVATAIDHFSRRVVGLAAFDRQPSSVQVRQFLARAIRRAGQPPKYLICDKGGQFWCDGFKSWCKRRGIKPRFGAVGKHGSIAVVERFIRTMKAECTRRLLLTPLRRESFRQELDLFATWYNEHRPHHWG
ncbi:MAG TPA: DDE-type integrase/transposase/recombinase [Phycisphaerae bacterium]|nr:DDE-type integrase/transposase/recombinase [Phycisphaerae bacterium]